MPYHVVEQGECLSAVAQRYGFRDWRTIYDDAKNAEFRQQRPDPNVIFPGDRLFVPPKQDKQAGARTGETHRFQVPARGKKLRIAIEAASGKPLASAAWELEVGEQTLSGTTDAKGRLEATVPIGTRSARLLVAEREWLLAVGDINPMENTPDNGVSGAQARLRNLGYDPGPVDGILGPRTRRALRLFQTDEGVEADGKLGAGTTSNLRKRHGC